VAESWRDSAGELEGDPERVAQTCAFGAAALVSRDRMTPTAVIHALERACEGLYPRSVNDGPDGHARILAAYDKAIAELEHA
jgi:hypothetical protein